MMRTLWLAWLFALMCLPSFARADSWAPATRQTYLSADQNARFTVEPRQIKSPLAFFKDKVKDKELAGQQRGGPTKAEGWLERRGPDGSWTILWRKPLVNDVAPVSALVSNDGAHVITFDNWHSLGWGDDAVVIYGADGTPVRAMPLTAFLPKHYVAVLPHSVSSIHWRGEPSLSAAGERLILPVTIPPEGDDPEARAFVRIEIDLATGRVIPPAGPAWEAALAQAHRVATAQQAYEAARIKALIDPLYGPKTQGEREWHDYLREAFMRTDAGWMEPNSSTTVLRDPTAEDYGASETWVHDALKEGGKGDVVSIASVGPPDNLVRVLGDAARAVKPGALKGARLYIVTTDQDRDRIAAILAPTGATFIQLDPTRPIPQRKERIPGSEEEKKARAKMMRRW